MNVYTLTLKWLKVCWCCALIVLFITEWVEVEFRDSFNDAKLNCFYQGHFPLPLISGIVCQLEHYLLYCSSIQQFRFHTFLSGTRNKYFTFGDIGRKGLFAVLVSNHESTSLILQSVLWCMVYGSHITTIMVLAYCSS